LTLQESIGDLVKDDVRFEVALFSPFIAALYSAPPHPLLVVFFFQIFFSAVPGRESRFSLRSFF